LKPGTKPITLSTTIGAADPLEIRSGPAIVPIERLKLFSPLDWEGFVNEWAMLCNPKAFGPLVLELLIEVHVGAAGFSMQGARPTAFDELNIIRASDLAHLADLTYIGRFNIRSAGPRVAIITVSGGDWHTPYSASHPPILRCLIRTIRRTGRNCPTLLAWVVRRSNDRPRPRATPFILSRARVTTQCASIRSRGASRFAA